MMIFTKMFRNENGVSELVGGMLILLIFVLILGLTQIYEVPRWNNEIEAEHYNTLYTDTLDLRQAIEKTPKSDVPRTAVIRASLDYPNRMFLNNPPKPGTTYSTFLDKEIQIISDSNPVKIISSCTIKINKNYNYFSAPELIIEHGMIIGKAGQDNFIMDDPLMIINDSHTNKKIINLFLVKCANNSIGTSSSISLHLFPELLDEIYGNNTSITFTTDYPDLWSTYLNSSKVNYNLSSDRKEITMNFTNSTIRINGSSIDFPPPPIPTPTSTVTVMPTPTVTPTPTPIPEISRTYSNDSDFDEGISTGLNHDVIHDQLQINNSVTNINYHFIWVPNTNLGTVSKVDTRTGNEEGRYRVNSNTAHGGNPSRTTVDLKGDVWVGTRQAGTVVKIGNVESGHCMDRNGDGTIQTSRDTNNDGNITGAEILSWGQDECVLYEVVLIPGYEGTFEPGKYNKSYDTDYVGVAPRGLAIDASNNLWAGTYSTGKYYYIDGATGQIKKTLDVSPWGHAAYGAVIDKNGILWSAKLRDHVLRINTSNLTDIKKININNTYGICLDYSGHLFTAGFITSGKSRLAKIDINGTNPTIMWDKPARTFRGVVSTPDNNIWVAGIDNDGSGTYNSVSRYDNIGNLIATISGFHDPSGVAVDDAGKVWVTDIGSNNIYRINPATNTVDLTKNIIGSDGHYTYSDMTGFIARTITTKIGTWTVIFDSETADIQWGMISWNRSEPAGTSIKVSVRSSNDNTNWSEWKNAANGIQLAPIIKGRYIEIETTLQILSGDTSPILYDLTIRSIP